MATFESIRFFGPEEFTDPEKMDQKLIERLDAARRFASMPFKITSSYRGGDPKSHGLGKGVDLACADSSKRQIMYDSLRRAGFHRIGVYDKHLHVDVATVEDGPDFVPNVTWWGKSK